MTSGYPIPVLPGSALTIYRGQSPLLTRHRHLCSVLERLAGGEGSLRGVFHGIPWCTPIVGTGCLELGEGPGIDLTALDPAADEFVKQRGIPFPRELGDPGLMATGFAEALYTGKTHGRAPVTTGPRVAPSPPAVGLTVSTALLARMFYGACMRTPSPVGHWWSREASVELTGESKIEANLRELELPVVIRVLQATRELLFDDESHGRAPERALIDQILTRLGTQPPFLFLEDLHLITEVTWLELIDETSIYPGWSDLLLKLLTTSTDVETTAPAGHRPKLIDLPELGTQVSKLLARSTEYSWKSRRESSEPHERGAFYSSIASLLQAQADVFTLLHPADPSTSDDWTTEAEYHQAAENFERAMRIKDAIQEDTRRDRAWKGRVPEVVIPHPVAFVTSFDIELEMSLWTAGKPFRVVLPVLCEAGRRRDANLVWLSALMTPPGPSDPSPRPLESVRGPHEWRVAHTIFNVGEGGEHPIVVRLSGSPMMDTPAVQGALRRDFDDMGFGRHETITLYHALTIDQYTSLRQSENELFFASSKQSLGLPRFLCTGTDSNERVWVGLGVQIDDSAIRARVFSQLSAGSLRRRTDQFERDAAEVRPAFDPDLAAVRGIAVNKRIDENEAMALYWLGFQFALDLDCGKLTPDIEHCAEHILRICEQAEAIEDASTTEADWHRAKNEACRIWTR